MNNKVKYIIPFIAGMFVSLPAAMGQEVDYEKDFDAFQKAQQEEFNEFKNKADAEFETFLRESWAKFEAFDPLEPPVRPEPVKQPVFD